MTRRRQIFLPFYGLIAAVMLVGIYAFVSFEQTAITTLPPAEDVVVFAPLTPTPVPSPLPTSPPLAEFPTTWQDFSPLFQDKCGVCHGGPEGLGGLNMSDYQAVLQGGLNGPGVVPSDPDASLLLIRQATGDHPGQLSGEELAALRSWIEAGAPEK